jgi:hypothetical protein
LTLTISVVGLGGFGSTSAVDPRISSSSSRRVSIRAINDRRLCGRSVGSSSVDAGALRKTVSTDLSILAWISIRTAGLPV